MRNYKNQPKPPAADGFMPRFETHEDARKAGYKYGYSLPLSSVLKPHAAAPAPLNVQRAFNALAVRDYDPVLDLVLLGMVQP